MLEAPNGNKGLLWWHAASPASRPLLAMSKENDLSVRLLALMPSHLGATSTVALGAFSFAFCT